jgi:ABC-2 type transport system permease protein
MWTFKAYFKKEFTEGVRQYKYIMLAAGILLFALLDPIMLKLLPDILKSQLPADLNALFVTTQKTAVQNYIKDLNQIGLMFVIFIVGGTLNDEVYNQKLVFPYSKGARPGSIVLAKFLNYSLAVCLFIIAGFLANYYYITILFSKDPLVFTSLMPSIVLVVIYFIFNISLAMLFSSIFKRGLVSGILTLAVSLTTSTLSGLKPIGKFVPYNLINAANQFSFNESTITLIFISALSLLFISITIIRMSKVEVS